MVSVPCLCTQERWSPMLRKSSWSALAVSPGLIEMRLKTCRVVRYMLSSCVEPPPRKIHSRYGPARLADLPWDGVPVVIHLKTRRFFCVEPGCRRKVFTEPLPGTVVRYGRQELPVERSAALVDPCPWRSSRSKTCGASGPVGQPVDAAARGSSEQTSGSG